MANSRPTGGCYIININDGKLLIEVVALANYADALREFNRIIEMGAFGRWKEVYLEGQDRAGQFIDVYLIHYFDQK
ncbi:MAG: hypothetical protein CL859_03695 [Cyanobium sp. ARS6]|nr:hypothetical protein [Cyanobium sp. ARS6]